MHKSRFILVSLLAALFLSARMSFGEQDYLPDTTPKEGIPVPMTTHKIPRLESKTGEEYAVGLLNDVMIDHGEIAIRFKTLSTEGDQEAGIVFRYKDPQNYYVITASAKDETCTLYRMKGGKRKMLNSQEVIVTPLTWHKLHITFVQENFTAFVDGELALGVKDSSFKGPGKVGLQIKSGSQIAFEDFRISK
jgi:hypothetical protein